MGKSNVTQNIERDLSYHLGEREKKVALIKRIEQLMASLPEHRERIEQIDRLIAASEMLLRDRVPDWTRDRVVPIRKFECRSPVEFGSGVRKALEVLRDAPTPLMTREITNEVLAREAVFDLDQQTWERFRCNVDAGLRKHKVNGLVASDERKPSRWWLVAKQVKEQVAEQSLGSLYSDSPQCYLD